MDIGPLSLHRSGLIPLLTGTPKSLSRLSLVFPQHKYDLKGIFYSFGYNSHNKTLYRDCFLKPVWRVTRNSTDWICLSPYPYREYFINFHAPQCSVPARLWQVLIHVTSRITTASH
jgi:hypothetical protein